MFEIVANLLKAGLMSSTELMVGLSNADNDAWRLFEQLSDEAQLQPLAEWARLVERYAWGLEDVAPHTTAQPVRARNTAAAAAPILARGHTACTLILYTAAFIVQTLTGVMVASPRGTASDTLPRLAATLQRTGLLTAVSSALLAAPACEVRSGDTLERSAAHLASALLNITNAVAALTRTLLQSGGQPGRGSPAAAPLMTLIAAPEVQRLLLAAMERVAELYERELGLAPAAGGGGGGGADGGASGGSSSAQSARETAGAAGGWPLFDDSVAPSVFMERKLAPVLRRWEVVCVAVDTWEAIRASGMAAAVLPPTVRLAPLAVRITRALAMAPPALPPIMDPAERARRTVVGQINITRRLCAVLLPQTPSNGGELPPPEAYVGAHEAWAWGLASAAQACARLLRTDSDPGVRAELRATQLPALVLNLEEHFELHMGGPHASKDVQDDAVRRLAGAGLLRTWDTALRLAADSGSPRLLRRVVRALPPCPGGPILPLLRETMRLRPPSAGAAASGAPAICSSLTALPPPVPVPDPWDGARELGWLVSAAKLVSRHGWEQSSGRGGGGDGGTTLTGEAFLALRELLRSSCLSPSGLPELLPELSEAGGSCASGPDPRSVAIMEASALAARALFATADVPFSGCRDHTAASESVQNIRLVLALRAANSEVTAVRSAARVLPPAVLLVARPLLPLGSAAAMLRKLAAGGGGSDTVHGTVTMYARRLSESVVTALAELAADPALEPHVRAALLAEPAGAETELPAGAVPSREAEVTAVRSAARVLPPAVLLVARPLLPLGSAAAMLRKLAAGGGGSDTVHGTVTMYARRLSESVVTALAELAADPALEPHVRAALLAEPAGAETELPAGAVPSREACTSPGLRPPSSDAAAFGFSAGYVAAAVAAFSPRSAEQLACLRAAAAEADRGNVSGAVGGSVDPGAGATASALTFAAHLVLRVAVAESPVAAPDPDEAALEPLQRLRLLGVPLPPPPGCRL
ncbi:hypothetical protein GPECTOR_343g85 [Gonium pectorale]|uniref:Uncharacterized protein n=1 Tax=Gonium pectorale TaxID=33097 RepID=A0A150FWQ8_GONPE|nr:hypothetical protein GPECTOR_343g85 [Gonium pectorale]|eukprot:KXZ41645.1 hypothetical protein GPECTOR_343g85 [Gonium pectorale]